MIKNNFIIAETDLLSQLGLQCLISNRLKDSDIATVPGLLELDKALQADAAAIVVVDLDSFEHDCLEALAALAAKFSQSRWLFLESWTNKTVLLYITEHFNQANFVLKANSVEVLEAAVLATVREQRYFCSQSLQMIMEDQKEKSDDAKRSQLTHTELELLQWFAAGKTVKEVACLRFSSYHTINTHRKNIFKKTGVNNIQELIRYALKHHLIDVTEYYI